MSTSNASNPDCLNCIRIVSCFDEPLTGNIGPRESASQRYLTPEPDVERQAGSVRGDMAAKLGLLHGPIRSTSIQKTRAVTRSAKFQLGHRMQLSLDSKFSKQTTHDDVAQGSLSAHGARDLLPIITTPPLSSMLGSSGSGQLPWLANPSPTLSDLSNYLGTPLPSVEREASPPMVDMELASPLPVSPDTYGWDVAWDRKFEKVA
jgi:hypothetical protein